MLRQPSPPQPARPPLPASGARLRGALGASSYLSPPAGRGRIASAIRVRGCLLKGSGYGFKHTHGVAKHIVVPESQNPIAPRHKPRIARRIARTSGMLSAIDFNDQTTLAADKVNGVRADRLLANEFPAVDDTRPQPLPKRQFGVRRIAAQSSRARGRFLVGSTHVEAPPHPARDARRPLPASGERLAQPAFTMVEKLL